jgi:hypothetical protein
MNRLRPGDVVAALLCAGALVGGYGLTVHEAKATPPKPAKVAPPQLVELGPGKPPQPGAGGAPGSIPLFGGVTK